MSGSIPTDSRRDDATLTRLPCCSSVGKKFDPLGVIRDCLAAWRGKPAAGRADPMRNTLLVLDSLSAFLFWDTAQGLQLVEQLTREPGLTAVLAIVHTDMHLAWELEELRRLATGTMEIRSLAADAPAPRLADGTLVVSFKRRTGRVRVETEQYKVQPDGTVSRFQPPAVQGGKVAAAAGPGKAESAAGSQLSKVEPLRSGMRLSLTDSERAARNGVVLPWEQSQAGCASQDDLQPVALPGQRLVQDGAGGTRAGMGFIVYERDSDNDGVDSDEDPDDDLDV